MPYSNITDLPLTVRHLLPRHAQKIYREAFNSAWRNYADAAKRRQSATREVTAHRVAWNAVKKAYRKSDHVWVSK